MHESTLALASSARKLFGPRRKEVVTQAKGIGPVEIGVG
jgi:hypothetical protein